MNTPPEHPNHPMPEGLRAAVEGTAPAPRTNYRSLNEQIYALFEQYERERDTERAQAMTLADRLDNAGRIRARWKDTEKDLPDLIRAAADDGMSAREISDRLGISHASNYVARVLRQHRATQAIGKGIAADHAAGNNTRDALTRYTAALADVPEESRDAAEQFLSQLRDAVEEHEQRAEPTSTDARAWARDYTRRHNRGESPTT